MYTQFIYHVQKLTRGVLRVGEGRLVGLGGLGLLVGLLLGDLLGLLLGDLLGDSFGDLSGRSRSLPLSTNSDSASKASA